MWDHASLSWARQIAYEQRATTTESVWQSEVAVLEETKFDEGFESAISDQTARSHFDREERGVPLARVDVFDELMVTNLFPVGQLSHLLQHNR